MTYRELRNDFANLTEEQLDCDVTIYVSQIDEYYPVLGGFSATEDGVLDQGHPYLYTAKADPNDNE